MKVLQNNYNKKEQEEIKKVESYPRKLVCESCRSELEYDKSDMRIGQYGCNFVDCPLCGYDNMLDDNEYNITLTADNIEFPTHFHHTSKEDGATDCCNTEEIRKYLKKAVEYFRKNKDEFHWYTWSGNLYISVNRFEGDEIYDITISNNFYTMEIPFEKEDY